MKVRSKKLAPVVSHARRQEEDAARTLAEAQQRVQDSEQQLEQLEAFRNEYLQNYQSRSQQSGSMTMILDYQAFISKINQGIQQAHQTISLCSQQRDVLRQQWVQKKKRSQALESVVEKYQDLERQHASKVEQREMDELSQQRFFSSTR